MIEGEGVFRGALDGMSQIAHTSIKQKKMYDARITRRNHDWLSGRLTCGLSSGL